MFFLKCIFYNWGILCVYHPKNLENKFRFVMHFFIFKAFERIRISTRETLYQDLLKYIERNECKTVWKFFFKYQSINQSIKIFYKIIFVKIVKNIGCAFQKYV